MKKPPKGYKTALVISQELGIERQKVYDIVKYFKVDKFNNGTTARSIARTFYPIDDIQTINNMLKKMTYKEVKRRLE